MEPSIETLEWIRQYYKAVDAGDIDTVMTYFAQDARSRFANGEVVYGRDAIRADLAAKSQGVRSISHHFNNIWEAEEGVIVLDATMKFTRHDGVTVPANGAGLFRYRDRVWTEQLHFVDLSDVFGAG
jgi:ketosteroid isomerase-like protein